MATQVKLRQLHSEVSQKWDDNAAAIAAEETRATNAEAVLTSNLATEISDRQAAVTAEASARSSADSTLQSNIDSEASTRASADTTLQGNIDAEEARAVAAEGVLTTNLAQEVSDREAAVTAEATARSSADTTLQSNIDTEKARVDAILNASEADKDSFAEIVTLINTVDTENDEAFAGYVLSNDAALAAEISRAQSAEAAIQADVDQNEADCDAGLSSASVDRAAIRSEFAEADSTLQSTLQGNIDSEASSRAAEDVVLMDSLESMGFHQGSFAGSAAEMPLGENYENAFPGSLSVFINGLEAQAEVDYSEVGSVLSVEGVASDDRVSFRYMYKSFKSLSGNDGGGEDLGGGEEGGGEEPPPEEGGGEGLLADQSLEYQDGWNAAKNGEPYSELESADWQGGHTDYGINPNMWPDA